MRSLLQTLFCLLVLFSFSPALLSQKLYASYTQVQDLNRDGKPSRCDCDYYQTTLSLEKDSTFMFQEIRGRLDPETKLLQSGTWQVQNDSLLVLHVTQQSGPYSQSKQDYTEICHLRQHDLRLNGRLLQGSGSLYTKP